MNTLRLLLATCASVILLMGCGPESAGGDSTNAEPPNATYKDFGEYELHFSAISTDTLQPDIARAYNITRSKNRAMLTVSIIEKVTGTPGKPVAGSVNASANNLTGQVKNLSVRQIQEGDAIYYIGDISVANAETLVFNISATPENHDGELSVRFSRQFFAD